MIRTVIDTNVLVSALLFSGEMGDIVSYWKARKFLPVFSHDTFDEFRRVLAYPKFSLTPREIDALLQDEVLPFCEVADIEDEIIGVCRDGADDKFLSCAVAAKADYIVSDDKDLLVLGNFRNIPIITAGQFWGSGL
ncbi:MAG: putative toxin-antitoxin system toxin component, PIN family [Syntrophobacterales bacterium]|nr:putative toxin-antitoxin system toxin component, PIN family [Syntrophobacterales bacterium]